MADIGIVGLDIAKSVFGIDAAGDVVVRGREAPPGLAVLCRAKAVPDRRGGLRYRPSPCAGATEARARGAADAAALCEALRQAPASVMRRH
jgi:hypothetical protein